jgi:2-polyprenyl-3-methyl-5-hydroxy-6-metoxy-1,4-benzoquinol methylase
MDPTIDAKRFYEENYQRSLEIATIPREDDFMYAQVLAQLRPLLRPGLKVLDLGCNNGNLSFYMAQHGCTVHGIDIAKNAVQAAQRGKIAHGIANVTFENIDFLRDWNSNNRFDLVLCSHVIEHIQHQTEFLQKIASVLTPTGLLLLFTPTSYSSLYRCSMRLTGRFAFDEEVGHLRRYTANSIREVLDEAGLQVQQTTLLDSVLREWFIVFKPLRWANILWCRKYIRTAFNAIDTLFARYGIFPASVCVIAHLADSHPKRSTDV